MQVLMTFDDLCQDAEASPESCGFSGPYPWTSSYFFTTCVPRSYPSWLPDSSLYTVSSVHASGPKVLTFVGF